jgi:uncharacterized protein (TIGR02265 family)
MSTSHDASAEGEAPHDWIREMESRQHLATPQDNARGLFFNGVLQTVRQLGDEAALARCQAAVGERRFLDFFNYPVAVLMRLTATATVELSARYGGPEETLRVLGRKGAEDFMTSAVANALRLLSGGDIKQLLGSVNTIYRMAANYGERTVLWQGPRSGRLIIRRSFMPVPYHEGVLEECLVRTGGRSVKVRGQQTGPLDGAYDFTWE